MRTCKHCSKKFDQTEATPRCEARDAPAGPCEGVPRGFAAMTREQVAEIASKGGVSAHASGKAHQFTTDEARAAGTLGGHAPHSSRGPAARKTAST